MFVYFYLGRKIFSLTIENQYLMIAFLIFGRHFTRENKLSPQNLFRLARLAAPLRFARRQR